MLKEVEATEKEKKEQPVGETEEPTGTREDPTVFEDPELLRRLLSSIYKPFFSLPIKIGFLVKGACKKISKWRKNDWHLVFWPTY